MVNSAIAYAAMAVWMADAALSATRIAELAMVEKLLPVVQYVLSVSALLNTIGELSKSYATRS